jgi:hypothetical protein
MRDLCEWWRNFRYDEWLLKWRSPFVGMFTVAVVVLIAWLTWTILRGPQLGLNSTEIIEGLLAIGTMALAFAALVQAVSSEKKRESDESQRRLELAPHLDIQLVWPEQERSYESLDTFGRDIFSISVFAGSRPYCKVRNLGPGTATNVFVAGYGLDVPIDSSSPVDLGKAVIRESIGYLPYVSNVSLAPNEYRPFPVSLAKPRDPVNSRIPYSSICRQLLLVAKCRNVEGKASPFVRYGIYAIGPLPTYPSTDVSWMVMDEGTAEQLQRIQTSGPSWP